MTTPAEEEDAVVRIGELTRMPSLPLTGVAAPDEQRRDRTESLPHACVCLQQQRQSLHSGEPADEEQHRTDDITVDERGEICI